MTASTTVTDHTSASPSYAPPTTAARVTLATVRRRYPQLSVPSPCIGVCKMDEAKGWCAGCFRTLDELTGWSRASDAAKVAVWSLVEQRQP